VSVHAAHTLSATGGGRLFTRSWLPDEEAADPEPARAAVIIVHGLGEHSGRYDAVAGRLVAAGYAVWACDHRGHGRSEGPREIFTVADVVADLDRFADRVIEQSAPAHPPVFMLGHSLGGMLAIRYALAHGERLAGLILSGALAAVDASPATVAIGRMLGAIAPRLGVIALDPELVSRDPAVVAAYRADPLVHHGRIPAATAALIAGTVARFPETVGAITLPTLILYGTADGLCPPRGSVMLGERLGSADVTTHAYAGLYHEVLNEPERETVIADVVGWLDAHAALAPGPVLRS
jgi:acylglycerol lipase